MIAPSKQEFALLRTIPGSFAWIGDLNARYCKPKVVAPDPNQCFPQTIAPMLRECPSDPDVEPNPSVISG